MELILEFLFELILEGSVELAGEKKVPMVLRILAALVLLAVYGGLLVMGILLLCSGIRKADWLLIAVSAFIILLIAAFAIKAVKKYKAGTSNED